MRGKVTDTLLYLVYMKGSGPHDPSLGSATSIILRFHLSIMLRMYFENMPTIIIELSLHNQQHNGQVTGDNRVCSTYNNKIVLSKLTSWLQRQIYN
jgi:hypothetical protein